MYYSIADLIKKKHLRVTSYRAIRELIVRHSKVLKPIVCGSGNGKRYMIPAANLKKLPRYELRA